MLVRAANSHQCTYVCIKYKHWPILLDSSKRIILKSKKCTCTYNVSLPLCNNMCGILYIAIANYINICKILVALYTKCLYTESQSHIVHNIFITISLYTSLTL